MDLVCNSTCRTGIYERDASQRDLVRLSLQTTQDQFLKLINIHEKINPQKRLRLKLLRFCVYIIYITYESKVGSFLLKPFFPCNQ